MALDPAALAAACGELSEDGGITIQADLEPLAGPGAPVKPATYQDARPQLDRRWWGDGDDREVVDVAVVDNEPSQANRLEAAMEALRGELGLPEIVLDLGPVGALPPHLPRRISGFRFPHRNADAYLRDALLDGSKFLSTPIGSAIFDATADRPLALLEWFPQALLFGFWQSHLGKKRSQAKLARAWVSEIVGYRPAATDIKRLGLKGDPLNLAIAGALEFDVADQVGKDWSLKGVDRAKTASGKVTEALSNVGHGQVLVRDSDAALAGMSFEAVEQRATVSFAGLRRIHTGSAEADATARALLVALGLVAHATAFGRSFSLRSGCELRSRRTSWTWLGASEDRAIPAMSASEAADLFRGCVAQAQAAGLPVGSRWASEPLVLEPNEALSKVIRAAWPLEG